MIAAPLSFFAPGTPAPGGSKKAFVNRKTGRANLVDAGKGNAEWKQQVALFASVAMAGRELFDGPLSVRLTFLVRRPAGHYGEGRNAGKVKPSAPLFPTGKPDALKLARAAEDALTGVVYLDDAQTVALTVVKQYADHGKPTGVQVDVAPLGAAR